MTLRSAKKALYALILAALFLPGVLSAEEEKNQGAFGLTLGYFPGVIVLTGIKLGYTRHTDSGFLFGVEGAIDCFYVSVPFIVSGELTAGWRFPLDEEQELRPLLLAGVATMVMNPLRGGGYTYRDGEDDSLLLHAGLGLDWKFSRHGSFGFEAGMNVPPGVEIDWNAPGILSLFFLRLTYKYLWFE